MAKIAGAAPKKASTPAAKRSNTTNSNGFNATEQAAIQQLAYQFYAERGYAHGHDREDWLRAEAIVRARRS